MKLQVRLIVLLLALTGALAACSHEQLYATGQSWQRNECNKLPDKGDYDRCVHEANTDYETYRRETQSPP